jgi:hypothetical protein
MVCQNHQPAGRQLFTLCRVSLLAYHTCLNLPVSVHVLLDLYTADGLYTTRSLVLVWGRLSVRRLTRPPKLTGRVWIGDLVRRFTLQGYLPTATPDGPKPPCCFCGVETPWSPQMLQLRCSPPAKCMLYRATSAFSSALVHWHPSLWIVRER